MWSKHNKTHGFEKFIPLIAADRTHLNHIKLDYCTVNFDCPDFSFRTRCACRTHSGSGQFSFFPHGNRICSLYLLPYITQSLTTSKWYVWQATNCDNRIRAITTPCAKRFPGLVGCGLKCWFFPHLTRRELTTRYMATITARDTHASTQIFPSIEWKPRLPPEQSYRSVVSSYPCIQNSKVTTYAKGDTTFAHTYNS